MTTPRDVSQVEISVTLADGRRFICCLQADMKGDEPALHKEVYGMASACACA